MTNTTEEHYGYRAVCVCGDSKVAVTRHTVEVWIRDHFDEIPAKDANHHHMAEIRAVIEQVENDAAE